MWTVELVGYDEDLGRIASLSQAPRWSVCDRDGGYILEADAFASSPDAAAVRDYARGILLPVINGIARMTFPRSMLSRISLGPGVDFTGSQGERIGHRFIQQSVVVSVSDTATVTVPSGPAPALTPPSMSVANLVTVLLHDQKVLDALDFFAYEDQWAVNLYKVFEIVRDDVGGKNQDLINRQWATDEELDNFRSVHDSEAIGRQARHAVRKQQSPTSPMSEDEARAFIRGVLEQWLRERHGQFGDGRP